ncbi:MAG: DUF1553 domain-containing protein [Planctomycetota bacterium]|jgi:hypothetical protein
MKRLLVLAVLFLAAPAVAEPEQTSLEPYESGTGFAPKGDIDLHVLTALEKRGITPSNPCSDAVFLRRAYVDVIGTLPTPQEVVRFLLDEHPGKRARLIDDLLEREEFTDYWTLKWGDLLRVKSEFPVNLWPNGVQAYHRWIRDAIKANRPYDEFARDLLTSSGSNFRVPPVNFYRAVQGQSPEAIASAVALTFLGARFDQWPEERRRGMAAFFSCLAYKPTAEWKEEIVIVDPAPREAFEAVFPDGTAVQIAPEEDPRRVFADWLLAPDNPWFARSIANRVWFWLMGRGIVHEPDDLRPDNPPSNPELLARLERELVAADYDLKHLFRFILNSRTYQGSPIPAGDHAEAEALFAHYSVRRLDAEVLIDALCRLDGAGENYASQVPEPFTFLTNVQRSIGLADGSITSPFLEMFGRPSRDTGLESERDNEPTDAQRLYLLNSTEVLRHIERSRWLRRLTSRAQGNRLGAIRPIYLAILSREPTRDELATAGAYFRGSARSPRESAMDLTWALINTKEFLYRH